MKKRILAILMVAAILVGVLPMTVFAAGTFTVSASDETTDANGEAVVKINIVNNPGIIGATFVIGYDANSLELTGITKGSSMPGSIMPNLSTGTIVWYETAECTTETIEGAFELTFKAKEGAFNGTYPITLSQEDDIYNGAYEAVEAPEYVAGSVTITTGVSTDDLIPSVSIEPEQVSYVYGEEAPVLTATVTDPVKKGEMSGQWYYYAFTDVNAPMGGYVLEGATDPVLDLNEYAPLDYTSWCFLYVVTNTYGDVSKVGVDTAIVTFSKSSQGRLSVEVADVVYGDNLADKVTVSGDPSVESAISYIVKSGEEVVFEGTNLSECKLNAGEYTLTVTKAGDDNHMAVSTTVDLTIAKADPVFTVSESLTVVVEGTAELGATLTGVNGEDLTAELGYDSKSDKIATVAEDGTVTGVKIGSTTITVTFEGDENYNSVSKTVAVEVTNRKPVEGFDLADATGTLIYAEGPQTLSSVLSNVVLPEGFDAANVTYTVTNEDGNVVSTGSTVAELTVTDAGVYTVTATYDDGEEYYATDSVTVRVNKSSQGRLTITIADPVTYGDDLSEKITVTGGSTNGEITYVVKAGDEVVYEGTDLSECELNAGEYTITATMAGDANHTAVYKTETLTIKKVKVAIPEPKTDLVYNGEVQYGVEASEYYDVAHSAEDPIDSNGYWTSVSLKDTENYEWADGTTDAKLIDWNIGKAPAQALTTSVSLRFNDTTAQNILDLIAEKLPGAATDESLFTVTSAKTASALIVIAEDKTTFAMAEDLEEQVATATIEVVFTSRNYLDSTMTITVNVMKKNPLPEGALTLEGGELTYNGDVQEWKKAKLARGYDKECLDYSYAPSIMIDAGTYTVTVVYDDGVNYGEATATVVINPAKPTIKFQKNGIKKGDILNDLIDDGKLTVTVTFNGKEVTGTFVWNEEEGTEVKRGKSYSYTFTPDSDNFVEITGKYKPLASASSGGGSSSGSSTTYVDVDSPDWYYDAVEYVTNLGLMNGTGDGTTFSPDMDVTRAMVVVTLWRMEGSPEVKYAMNYSDVEDGMWYTEAIRWATAKGVVTGYGGTDKFGPEDVITREQLAVMLYRYADRSAASGDPLASYPDGAETNSWAKEGMSWAVSVGLLSGDDNGHLNPTDTASRAELATILMRYMQYVR